VEILYIIGNGFDLNIGLNTSYKDFYEYFKRQSNEDAFYENVDERIKERINEWIEDVEKTPFDTWADLESALGEYTNEFDSVEEFEGFYLKISDELSKYIQLEESKLTSFDKEKSKLSQDFIWPWAYMSNKDKHSIQIFCETCRNDSEWVVNIINFNYSQTIEKLLNFTTDGRKLLGNSIYKRETFLSTIVHIHGVAGDEETILLGVNDIYQIKNESFRTDENLLDIIVKPQTNQKMGSEIDERCINFFNKANLICIFGSSFGETDKMWWKLLGEQIKRDNCRVIYFVYENPPIPKNHKQLLPRKKRECKDFILSKTGFIHQEKENVKDKVFIEYNTNMFKLDIIK
jgi:hypothetical protein